MKTAATNKEHTIGKLHAIISNSETEHNKWKIGMASIQRLSLLSVPNEIHYFPQDALIANEVLFHFMAQGVQVCKLSKVHSDGVYIYC